mgnify:CR=1 FL=1
MERLMGTDSQLWVEEHCGCQPANVEHFHQHYELYYLAQGEIRYFIGNKTYHVKEGTLIIIPPSTLHKTFASQEPHRTRILINLSENYLKEFTALQKELLPDSGTAFYSIQKQERIYQIIYELLNEFQNEKNILMQKSLVCELLVLLSRRKKSTIVEATGNPLSKKLSDVVSYINAEYPQHITLTALAERFQMNPAYLSRIFKQGTGFSFSEYLNKFRIKKAVALLEISESNITEISLEVGFNSCNHFCKIFKSIMGVSPLVYKKQNYPKN